MPKGFKFSLKKVLEYRQSIEDLQAVTVQKSLSAKLQKEAQLTSLNEEKNSALSSEKSIYSKNKKLDINQINIYKSYMREINKDIQVKTNEVDLSKRKYETDREKLLEISKERKIVENLQERKLVEFLNERKQKEMKNESEVAIRVSGNTNQTKDY